VSKISLEEDKAFFTQEKKSEEDKNSGKKSQLFSPAYEKVEEGSKAAGCLVAKQILSNSSTHSCKQ